MNEQLLPPAQKDGVSTLPLTLGGEWREEDIVIFLKDENTTFRPEDGLAGKDAHH